MPQPRASRAKTSTDSTRGLLTIPDAALQLSISKSTLWRWISLGAVPVQRKGGFTRIRQTTVDHILTHDFAIPSVRKYEEA
jgi:excisionase family DNA binding protein